MPRFFIPNLDEPQLTGPEAHHATKVLRLQTGDTVTAFDGLGGVAECKIAAADKNRVQLTVTSRTSVPPLPCRLMLGAALIKKQFEFIVQKATELGVASIIPLITEHTVVRTGKPQRWREIALEACKQCGNNWLPDISAPQTVDELMSCPPAVDLTLVASLQPETKSIRETLGTGPVRSILLLVGPEGDFTAAEYDRFRLALKAQPVTLGPLVLRADTAVLYALSVLHHELVAQPSVAFPRSV